MPGKGPEGGRKAAEMGGEAEGVVHRWMSGAWALRRGRGGVDLGQCLSKQEESALGKFFWYGVMRALCKTEPAQLVGACRASGCTDPTVAAGGAESTRGAGRSRREVCRGRRRNEIRRGMGKRSTRDGAPVELGGRGEATAQRCQARAAKQAPEIADLEAASRTEKRWRRTARQSPRADPRGWNHGSTGKSSQVSLNGDTGEPPRGTIDQAQVEGSWVGAAAAPAAVRKNEADAARSGAREAGEGEVRGSSERGAKSGHRKNATGWGGATRRQKHRGKGMEEAGESGREREGHSAGGGGA